MCHTVYTYDLCIHGGRVVDPANAVDATCDILVQNSQVVALTPPGDKVHTSARVLDARGKYVFPGVIDTHVHLSSRYSAPVAHKMLARAGVTTALDMGAAPADAIALAARHGAGLTVASLGGMDPSPGGNLPGRDAPPAAIRSAIDRCLDGGSLGIKIHFDNKLTPEATQAAIAEANNQKAWVAFHCGTTATASDITGLREAVALAADNRLHLAHVNSYCRGNVSDPVAEAQECIDLLLSAPHLFSESYLAVINGTSARCVDGRPALERVEMWLEMGGFAPTQTGLRDAIMAGWARIHSVQGEDTVLATGEPGVRAWLAAQTHIGLSFPVNPPMPRLMLAAAKDPTTGAFVVDALGTDGGGIPRNVLLQDGLLLVALEVLTLSELVRKISWTPARVLGLPSKGHLTPGADADITVVDPIHRRASTTICHGEIVMHEGIVVGRGSRFVTTARGAAAVRAGGCEPVVVDVGRSGFYTGEGLKPRSSA
jgi:cytosine/adenosine deaminase-related metal-dependent hydrolase